MKEDFADNYSIKKWLDSLGVGKKLMSFVFIATLLGGLGFAAIDWIGSKIEKRIVLKEAIALEDSYYDGANQKVRIEERNDRKIVLFSNTPNYFMSFSQGALVLFVSTSITSLLALRSEPADGGNG